MPTCPHCDRHVPREHVEAHRAEHAPKLRLPALAAKGRRMRARTRLAAQAVDDVLREEPDGIPDDIMEAAAEVRRLHAMREEPDEAPRCVGRWTGGSGGHRRHDPCGEPATWTEPDGYAYCDEHVPPADVERGYVERA